jgi:hypothetical protein
MAWESVPGGLQGIVVHNVAEAAAGSHTLPQGRVIHVEERLDHGNPPTLVYLASVEPASSVQRLARIVSYDSGSYTVQPVLLGTGGLADDGPPISGVPNLGELWPDEAGYLDGPAGYDRYVELLGGPGGYAFILHPPRMV